MTPIAARTVTFLFTGIVASQPNFADRFEYERDLAMAQTLLKPAAFAAARAEGRALTMAQAVSLALADSGMEMLHDSAM